nr:hypothetical protein [Cellulosimicrobium sp. MM]
MDCGGSSTPTPSGAGGLELGSLVLRRELGALLGAVELPDAEPRAHRRGDEEEHEQPDDPGLAGDRPERAGRGGLGHDPTVSGARAGPRIRTAWRANVTRRPAALEAGDNVLGRGSRARDLGPFVPSWAQVTPPGRQEE